MQVSNHSNWPVFWGCEIYLASRNNGCTQSMFVLRLSFECLFISFLGIICVLWEKMSHNSKYYTTKSLSHSITGRPSHIKVLHDSTLWIISGKQHQIIVTAESKLYVLINLCTVSGSLSTMSLGLFMYTLRSTVHKISLDKNKKGGTMQQTCKNGTYSTASVHIKVHPLYKENISSVTIYRLSFCCLFLLNSQGMWSCPNQWLCGPNRTCANGWRNTVPISTRSTATPSNNMTSQVLFGICLSLTVSHLLFFFHTINRHRSCTVSQVQSTVNYDHSKRRSHSLLSGAMIRFSKCLESV